jgi:hypothetical protein
MMSLVGLSEFGNLSFLQVLSTTPSLFNLNHNTSFPIKILQT